jgi:hypothetical protein
MANIVACRINGNAYKLCFWILAYVLHNRTLLSELCTEITSVVRQGTTDLETRLERCPRLESVFNEVEVFSLFPMALFATPSRLQVKASPMRTENARLRLDSPSLGKELNGLEWAVN